MIYQTFSRYYQLSLIENEIPQILCKSDGEHGSLVPNMTNDDKIYLYCVECNYKLHPGLTMYKKLNDILKNFEGSKEKNGG